MKQKDYEFRGLFINLLSTQQHAIFHNYANLPHCDITDLNTIVVHVYCQASMTRTSLNNKSKTSEV